MAGGTAQMVEYLPGSSLSTTKKKKKRKDWGPTISIEKVPPATWRLPTRPHFWQFLLLPDRAKLGWYGPFNFHNYRTIMNSVASNILVHVF
jgi:hypothetical protein